MKEQWRHFLTAGTRGQTDYYVSNKGRVKAVRILKDQVTRNGYHYVVLPLREGYSANQIAVHRIVLQAFKGPPQEMGLCCRHLDGNPHNNHPSNLAWGTYSRNQHDRRLHGTDCDGVNSPLAKLTQEQVAYIRQSKESQRTLAKKLAVSQSTISYAKRQLTYRRMPNGK